MGCKAADANCSALEDSAQPNALEQQRHERIKLNNAKLAAIGLLPRQQPAKRPRPRQKETVERPAAAQARQSARLQNIAPEHAPAREEQKARLMVGQHRPAALRMPQSEEEQQEYDAALRQHNTYRLQTMSDKALQARIHRIRNVDKMRSFIEVLETTGKVELAEEAKDALHNLLGSV